MDDDAMAAYLDGKEPDEDDAASADPQGDGHARLLPDAVRLGVQEQGRAAAARRGRGLPAVARPIAKPIKGIDSRPASRTVRRPLGRRAAVDARLQDHGHQYVGSITFCRVYSGKLEKGMALAQHDARQERARRPHAISCMPNNREDIKEAFAGDIVALRASRIPAPARRCAIRSKPVHPGEDGVPRARHRDRDRAEVEGRPGEDGASRCTSWRSRTPRSACRSIRNRARPSSRAWASFISTSRSTS